MLISIITINYNDLNGLKKTMSSVFDQTYAHIEYVIIDGNSDDGSAAYIESFKDELSYWVSEPDDGVYDAMNKGIDQASGDYLLFLNSGDFLVDQDVLSAFATKQPTEQLVYGDVYKVVNDKMTLFKMPEIDGLVTGLKNSLIHQAVFFSKSLFADNQRYDTSYKIAADWVFINNALAQKCSIRHIDLVIVCYDTNGLSSDKSLRQKDRKRYLEETFDENFRVLLHENQTLKRDFSYLKEKFIVKAYLKCSAFMKKIKSLFTSN